MLGLLFILDEKDGVKPLVQKLECVVLSTKKLTDCSRTKSTPAFFFFVFFLWRISQSIGEARVRSQLEIESKLSRPFKGHN